MRKFGFSTGALAKSDICQALDIAANYQTEAVEYSALRLGEVESMVQFLIVHGVGPYSYVAFHAPSRFTAQEEGSIVAMLQKLATHLAQQGVALKVVLHPDTIHQHQLWEGFGEHLCIENMDDRKAVGRTAEELDLVFAKLPKARLCFDIGHAHEIDRSMSLGYEILKRHRNRLAHIHASEVSDDCEHRAFSASSHAAFTKLVGLIPSETPVILEMEVPENRFGAQLEEARSIFERLVE